MEKSPFRRNVPKPAIKHWFGEIKADRPFKRYRFDVVIKPFPMEWTFQLQKDVQNVGELHTEAPLLMETGNNVFAIGPVEHNAVLLI